MNEGLTPKVTIVTACRNCKEDIRETIESVLAQDYPNLEYLIIDGASTDGTLDIINEYADRVSQIVSEPDNGVYDAMNKGIRLASGSWINFMNAGDVFPDSNVISKLFSNLKDFDRVVYGKSLYIYCDGSVSHHNTATIKELGNVLKSYHPYSHQAAFFNITDKSDCLFDTRYKICADYDVSIRYFLKYGIKSYSYVDTDVVKYKAYGGISCNGSSLEKESIIIRLRRRFGLPQALYAIMRRIILKILCLRNGEKAVRSE